MNAITSFQSSQHRGLLLAAALLVSATPFVFGQASPGKVSPIDPAAVPPSGGAPSSGTVTSGTSTGTTVTSSVTGDNKTTDKIVASATATANLPGRQITAAADGGVTIRTEGDRAMVHVATHVITIEPERLLIDGQEGARFPRSAENLQLTWSKSQLTVKADGSEILSRSLEPGK